MRRRIWGVHALALGVLVAAAACFPDPPPDEGILDSGILLPDGSVIGPNDGAPASGLVVSASTLDFGLAECGGVAPASQKLTLTNTSSSTVTFGAAASGSDFAVVAPANGQIVAGGKVDLTVSTTGVSAFAQAGGLIEGALQIVTDAPGQKLFVVDLKKTAAGAQLVMIPNVADFGLVAANFLADGGDPPVTLDVGFRNNGNEPLTVVFDDAPSYPYALESDDDAGVGLTVAPNATKLLHASYIPQGESLSTTVNFHTTGAICGGPSPSSILLTSSGVPTGFPSIRPGIVTFDVGGTGLVPCGQVAKSQTVTVSNPDNGVYTSLSIVGMSITGPFSVAPFIDPADAGAGIALAAGQSQALTITPQTVVAPVSTAPDGASGTLQIALSNEQSFTVKLSQTAQGAALAFSATSLAFGAVPVDTLSQQLLGIVNSGNAAVGVTLGISGSPYFSVSPSAQFSVNTPGGSSTVSYLPLATGAAQGTLSLQVSGPVCQLPVPATVTLSGNGTAPVDAGSNDAGDDAGSLGPDGGLIDDGGGISVDAAIK